MIPVRAGAAGRRWWRWFKRDYRNRKKSSGWNPPEGDGSSQQQETVSELRIRTRGNTLMLLLDELSRRYRGHWGITDGFPLFRQFCCGLINRMIHWGCLFLADSTQCTLMHHVFIKQRDIQGHHRSVCVVLKLQCSLMVYLSVYLFIYLIFDINFFFKEKPTQSGNWRFSSWDIFVWRA